MARSGAWLVPAALVVALTACGRVGFDGSDGAGGGLDASVVPDAGDTPRDAPVSALDAGDRPLDAGLGLPDAGPLDACAGDRCRLDGEPCTVDLQCMVTCIRGVCAQLSRPGGACESDGDCVDLVTCGGAGVCVLPDGAPCTSNGDCVSVCIATTCHPASGLGGPCDENADCHDALTCGAGGTCSAPTFVCGDAVLDRDGASYPTITLGTQCWLGRNLDVGVRVAGAVAQTPTAGPEKYCFDDVAANCTSAGGLYQWDEAMDYSVVAGAQGLCPDGSHIPTDEEWKTLEGFLGMDSTTRELFDFRGTSEGTALKVGGSSGFRAVLIGIRVTDGTFFWGGTDAFFWSSTAALAGANGISRRVSSASGGIERYGYDQNNGFSIRCLMN